MGEGGEDAVSQRFPLEAGGHATPATTFRFIPGALLYSVGVVLPVFEWAAASSIVRFLL